MELRVLILAGTRWLRRGVEWRELQILDCGKRYLGEVGGSIEFDEEGNPEI